MIYLQTNFLCTNIREKLRKNTIYNQRRSYVNISENYFESNIYVYKLEKTKTIYKINFYQLENLNVEWSGANSICENFTFGIKIRKCIPNLLISIHRVTRKPLLTPELFCFVSSTCKYLSLLISLHFLLTPLQENLSFAPKQQQVFEHNPIIPCPSHLTLKRPGVRLSYALCSGVSVRGNQLNLWASNSAFNSGLTKLSTLSPETAIYVYILDSLQLVNTTQSQCKAQLIRNSNKLYLSTMSVIT